MSIFLGVFAIWEWASVLGSSPCPVVECTNSLQTGICYNFDQGKYVIQIQACPINQLCAIDQMASTSSYNLSQSQVSCQSTTWLPGLKFPGETCVVNQECRSKICANDLCQGSYAGQICTDFADCAPGLVCGTNLICKYQLPAGQTCLLDSDCTNDCLCYKNSCIPYFSLPINTPQISNPSQCESGYSASNSTCQSAPANKNLPDSVCYSNSDCPLTNGGPGLCMCGMNTLGLPFCETQPGDVEFLSYKAVFLDVMNTSITCHYNISYSSRCPAQAANPRFGAYLVSLYIYYYRPAIIGIPSCVYGIMPFASNYSYAGETLSDSSGTNSTVVIVVSVSVFSVLLLLGIVCFICVKKFAREDNFQMQLRLRIQNHDYAAIPVYDGKPPDSPAESGSFQAKFSIEDIVLNEKDSKFLKTGIPVARSVHQDTNEILDEIEQGLVLAIPWDAKPMEVQPYSEGDTHPSATLFYQRVSK